MSARFAILLPLCANLFTIACREEPITRTRVPKSESIASRASSSSMSTPSDMDMPSERPRGLRWTLPSGWKEVPGNGMRLATFVPPGGLKTEVTVVALPGESGGELANANRWRGQIGLPPTDEAGMNASRTTFATKVGPATLLDITSTGAVRTRLIAATINTGGTTWFFKLMGDAAATQSARAGFLSILKGLAPDAPK